MTQQTPKGLTYPEASDHTRLWEHIQQLAEDTDEALNPAGALIPWHIVVVGTFSFASGSGNITYGSSPGFDMPAGWQWAIPPAPIVQARSNSFPTYDYTFAVGNVDTTGFTVHAFRDGSQLGTASVAVVCTVTGFIERTP